MISALIVLAAAANDPTWTVDLGLGITGAWKTQESQLLDQEGYSRLRFSAFAGGAWYPGPIGIGGWLSYTTASSGATHGGPVLNETITMAGVSVPVPVFTDDIAFFIVPRFARAWQTLSLHGDGHATSGFAYGGDLQLFSRKFHVGGILRFLRAPIRSQGAARDDDAGGVFVGLGGFFGG
jgi:hypothetical protein